MSASVSCSVRDLVNVDTQSPGTQVDNSIVKTFQGALGLYYGALDAAADGAAAYTQLTGFMTDELTAAPGGNTPDAVLDADERQGELQDNEDFFQILTAVRAQGETAVGALLSYPTLTPKAYLGELYALRGYIEVLMVEGYCSGIPLASVPYDGNFQYSAGFSTNEVLQHALALFDTALVYGQDSVPVATLARVGQGRAYLDLGEYSAAAAAVHTIPIAAEYKVSRSAETAQLWKAFPNLMGASQIVNKEGGNGLQWLAGSPTMQDPRVPITTDTVNGVVQFASPVQQAKYQGKFVNTLILANGIEARLIEAEAQLSPAASPSGPWLTTLNMLRASVGLADTTDPGTADDRIDLLFHERAFWLYLTGHRLGDLRRLVHFYDQIPDAVYPWGYYSLPSVTRVSYGNLVVIPVPAEEQERNVLYHGCVSLDP